MMVNDVERSQSEPLIPKKIRPRLRPAWLFLQLWQCGNINGALYPEVYKRDLECKLTSIDVSTITLQIGCWMSISKTKSLDHMVVHLWTFQVTSGGQRSTSQTAVGRTSKFVMAILCPNPNSIFLSMDICIQYTPILYKHTYIYIYSLGKIVCICIHIYIYVLPKTYVYIYIYDVDDTYIIYI